MATMASHYDLARFGSERLSFSPRQADLLMVMGTIAKKMGPVLRQVYLQMAEPRWVLSVGACASSGGIFDTYSVLQGIDQVIPVDVYVPGCPPRPEAILDGLMKIQDLVGKESIRRRNGEQYKALLSEYGIQLALNFMTPQQGYYLLAILISSIVLSLVPAFNACRRALGDGLAVKY